MSAQAWACQTAVVGAIASLAGGRVYGDAPASVVFPWIEVARAQSIPDDTTAETGGADGGVSDFFDLHIWSRYAGDREVLEIVDGISGRLHGATLAIDGRASALAWIRGVRGILRDPDGITRHGIVSVEIIHRS